MPWRRSNRPSRFARPVKRFLPLVNAIRFGDGSHTWLSAEWDWRRPHLVTLREWFRALSREQVNHEPQTTAMDLTTGHTPTMFVWAFLWMWLRRRWERLP